MSTEIRYPRPLRPGDTVAVTAPSAPVRPEHEARLTFVTDWLRGRGFEVVLGECLIGDDITSGSARARADELNAFVRDQAVRAVVPPWGGEAGIDVLPWLDLDLLSQCDPTWYVGFSDTTTTMLPLTLRAGWATLHGSNLMDTPYAPAPGHLHWLDVATADPAVPAHAADAAADPAPRSARRRARYSSISSEGTSRRMRKRRRLRGERSARAQ